MAGHSPEGKDGVNDGGEKCKANDDGVSGRR